MSARFRIAVAALAVALAVAACGSSSATPTPSAPASSAPESSAPLPSASGDAPTALPTFTRVPELEALLPTTVNGIPMQIVSLTGSDVVVGGIDANQNDVTAFLGALGKQPADLTFAFSADPKRALPILIGVYVVKGVDADAVATVLIDRVVAADPATKKTEETIGGKKVVLLERLMPAASPAPGASPSPGQTIFESFYASGDKLFRVSGPSRTYIADGLALIE